MARINALTGAHEIPEGPPPGKTKPRVRRHSIIDVKAIPAHTLLLLAGDPHADAGEIRIHFGVYCQLNPQYTDWRQAWDAFKHLNPNLVKTAKPENAGEGVSVQFSPSLKPLLARLFPKNLKKVIEARGDKSAFEAALRGGPGFARKYIHGGYQPLSIEVLPPSMCPAGVPAVAVSHSFLQNGDLMRDPEIVFAVAEWDAWLPYEITQDPVGIYRNAYNDGALYPRVVSDMTGLVNAWARNLLAQEWHKPPKAMENAPSVGAMIEQAQAANIARFPEPPDPVRDLLALIKATSFKKPAKQK